MNEKDLYYSKSKHKVGDLVRLRDTSVLAVVIGKQEEWLDDYNDSARFGSDPSYLYKLHFCGENLSDPRWVPEDTLQFTKGTK